VNQKQAAAEQAASLIRDGMIVGLGSGSTAELVLPLLVGRRISGVPTSERTAARARELGIPLTTLEQRPQIDLAVDGADQIELGSFNLIKGRGGALLREKIVAAASRQLVIVADESKLTGRLNIAVPVEVTPFGWQTTAERLRRLGANPTLRENFRSDEGHYVLDCGFGEIASAENLAQYLDAAIGVVEHGLFLGMATRIFVGRDEILRAG
jgi:ribose 5-phosphate isomerase A